MGIEISFTQMLMYVSIEVIKICYPDFLYGIAVENCKRGGLLQ